MSDSRDTDALPLVADPDISEGCFGAYYYQHCCGGGPGYTRDRAWLEFFGKIADRIVSDIGPRRVLDAGCGFGFLVEALRERGVEAYGLDISGFAIGQVHPAVKPYCRQGLMTEDLGGPYDLIATIEVLEHMTNTGVIASEAKQSQV